MEENTLEGRRSSLEDDHPQVDLLDLLLLLAKRKKLLAGVTLGAAVAAAVISLVMTPVFRAETKILPPQTSSSMASQLLGQLGAATGLLGAVPSGKSTGDLYVELIKSRTVLDRIVDRFKLMDVYKTSTREETRRCLAEKITARNNIKSGIITLSVEDTDPRRASAMANAVVEELKILNKGLSVTEAAQRRLFFEEQLKDAKDGLSRAEDAMKAFQEKSGAVKIDAQADAVIQGISALRARIAAQEVQIRVMKTYSTEQNPDILRAKEELSGMQEQLSRLEAKNGGGDILVPTGNIPQASTEYARRMRDLKFSETLYELLFSQYQAAKLDEARDAAVVQVVEKAVPPEQRAKPRRTLMVFLAACFGLFASFLAACFLEYRENAVRDPGKSMKLALLRKHLKLG